jgi:hypothetical protein
MLGPLYRISISVYIFESILHIAVDETTDALGRFVANLIVDKLDPEAPSR